MRVKMMSKLHHKPARETTGMTQAVVNFVSCRDNIAELSLVYISKGRNVSWLICRDALGR